MIIISQVGTFLIVKVSDATVGLNGMMSRFVKFNNNNNHNYHRYPDLYHSASSNSNSDSAATDYAMCR